MQSPEYRAEKLLKGKKAGMHAACVWGNDDACGESINNIPKGTAKVEEYVEKETAITAIDMFFQQHGWKHLKDSNQE